VIDRGIPENPPKMDVPIITALSGGRDNHGQNFSSSDQDNCIGTVQARSISDKLVT
jgi:hypothetical protein